MAGEKQSDGSLKSYMDYAPEEVLSKSLLSVKQDVKLLGENIVPLGGVGLKATLEKHGVNTEDVDYFSAPYVERIFQR